MKLPFISMSKLLPEKKLETSELGDITEHQFKNGRENKNTMVFFVRFPIKEQVHFAKRMAFLIGADVPMLESLYLLQKQAKSSALKHLYNEIIYDVSNGSYLSTSLAKYKKHFGSFAVNIIRIGETRGALRQNLNYLADELKKSQEIRKKVIGALVYPIFITIVTLVLSGMLTVFIFPKIMPIFQSLNVQLPITTIILLAVSNFLAVYGLHLIGGIILFTVIFAVLLRNIEAFRLFIHHTILRLPLAGHLAKYYNMANFCRTLGLLLKSDVDVIEAILTVGETTNNLVYRNEYRHMASVVERGERISTYIERHQRYFPDFTAHLIAVGEMSGSLSDSLIYLSETYESDIDDMTKNLSNSIEPLLMIFMGLIVGFVAVSVITPIYEVTQHLNPK
jgi:type IV pilus assembly protein PilC